MRYACKRAGFTLVELLVVIGIIAVLIGILLPTLNKARQQASTVACLANEHQMGLLLAEYGAENKGWLPYGEAANPMVAGGAGSPVGTGWGWWNAATWTWCDTLSLMLNKTPNDGSKIFGNISWATPGMLQNYAKDYSGIFHDKDVPDASWAVRASDYTCNPRIMGSQHYADGYFAYNFSGKYSNAVQTHRNVASIKSAGNVMAVWCTGVFINGSGQDIGGFEVGDTLDQSNICTAVGQVYPPICGYGQNALGVRIAIGNSGAQGSAFGSGTGDNLQSLKIENHDATTGGYYYDIDAMRFRHQNNKNCNALFVDGHAETRVLGNVYGRDIYTNAPQTPGTQAGT